MCSYTEIANKIQDDCIFDPNISISNSQPKKHNFIRIYTKSASIGKENNQGMGCKSNKGCLYGMHKTNNIKYGIEELTNEDKSNIYANSMKSEIYHNNSQMRNTNKGWMPNDSHIYKNTHQINNYVIPEKELIQKEPPRQTKLFTDEEILTLLGIDGAPGLIKKNKPLQNCNTSIETTYSEKKKLIPNSMIKSPIKYYSQPPKIFSNLEPVRKARSPIQNTSSEKLNKNYLKYSKLLNCSIQKETHKQNSCKTDRRTSKSMGFPNKLVKSSNISPKAKFKPRASNSFETLPDKKLMLELQNANKIIEKIQTQLDNEKRMKEQIINSVIENEMKTKINKENFENSQEAHLNMLRKLANEKIDLLGKCEKYKEKIILVERNSEQKLEELVGHNDIEIKTKEQTWNNETQKKYKVFMQEKEREIQEIENNYTNEITELENSHHKELIEQKDQIVGEYERKNKILINKLEERQNIALNFEKDNYREKLQEHYLVQDLNLAEKSKQTKNLLMQEYNKFKLKKKNKYRTQLASQKKEKEEKLSKMSIEHMNRVEELEVKTNKEKEDLREEIIGEFEGWKSTFMKNQREVKDQMGVEHQKEIKRLLVQIDQEQNIIRNFDQKIFDLEEKYKIEIIMLENRIEGWVERYENMKIVHDLDTNSAKYTKKNSDIKSAEIINKLEKTIATLNLRLNNNNLESKTKQLKMEEMYEGYKEKMENKFKKQKKELDKLKGKFFLATKN